MNCKHCSKPLSTSFHNVWEHRGYCNACGPLFYTKVRRPSGEEYEVLVEDLMRQSRARMQERREQKLTELVFNSKPVFDGPFDPSWSIEMRPPHEFSEESIRMLEELDARRAEYVRSLPDLLSIDPIPFFSVKPTGSVKAKP